MATCPECGAGVAAGARFCATCGATLRAPGSERRKLVTILFSDLTGSTQLGERHDAETVRRVLRRYFDEFSKILVRHGATLEKFIGDAVLAVFGIPAAHEDDALRALRAAVEMQAALGRLNDEFEPLYGVRLANHTGINTGEVVTGEPNTQTLATGDAVNVAARLQQSAGSGEILIGESTYELVRETVDAELLPPLELKGKSVPVTAWRLLAVHPDRRPRQLDAPLVGRADELRTLLAELESAAAANACLRVTVTGEPGIGKSRLVLELARRAVGRARVLQARCLSYGEGITYWPLAEIVRAAAMIRDDTTQQQALQQLRELLSDESDGELIAARVAGAIGLSERPGPAEETAWAARRLFEALARERPLLLVFDDVHWGEPAFLDLLDSVTAGSRAPILLVTAARPDLLESRAEPTGTTIHLQPLAPGDADQLIDVLSADQPVTEDVCTRVRAAAEGNPLFLTETLAMLRQRPHATTIPTTLQSLLSARLDALAPSELDLLVRASVVGQEISRAALTALVEDDGNLDATVSALARKDLLWPVPSTYAEQAYRFRHVLVRDAAYAAGLKQLRAELHERFARWLAETSRERLHEYEEVIGYHLERAHRYRLEIAPGDPAAPALAADAARALGHAGRRAVARGDTHAANDLLSRATQLEPDRVRRAELLTLLAETRLNSGDLLVARELAQEALEAATNHDRAVELRATLRLRQIESFTNPSVDQAQVATDAKTAAAELEQLGDLWGAAEAWMLQLYYAMTIGYDELIRVTQTAQQLARRAGSGRVEAEAVTWQGVGVLAGPMPLGDAVAHCERLCAEASGPLAEAHALHPTVYAYALAGRIDEGREAGARSAEIFHELGLEYWVQGVALTRALLERLVGERDREEQLLRSAVTFFQAAGDTAFLSTYAAELALTLAETGRPDEALQWAELSKANTADADVDAQMQWRLARAKALETLGELDEAEDLARAAVGYAFLRDVPLNRGQALIILAEILQTADKLDQAHIIGAQALDELKRKGSDLAVQQARRRLETITV